MAERKKIGEMRPSQLITTFGPGAIVDLPNISAIVAGIDFWDRKRCIPITEPRLQAKLRLKQILTPPLPPERSSSRSLPPTLPVIRFPEYMVCPICRRLAPFGDFAATQDDGVLWCYHPETQFFKVAARAKAFPVRFVVACSNGHIHDMPWERYAHGGGTGKQHCQDPKLFLEEVGATGSISNVQVRCKTCGVERSLSDAFGNRDPHTLGYCKGWRPWLGKNGDDRFCGKTLRAMLRGASNAYFPIVDSALTIPPHADNPAYDVIGDLTDNLEVVDSLDMLKSSWHFFAKARDRGITPEQLWEAWQQHRGVTEEQANDLRGPEWSELLKGSQTDGAYDFETAEQEVPDLFKGHIARLIQVRRLREVRVLTGFTRIDPPADTTTLLSGELDMHPTSTQASLTRNSKRTWLPGVVVRGEGVFLALDEDRLKEWEESVSPSVGEYMEEAYQKFCADRNLDDPEPFPGIRYVLLHSLAHALIRQLSLSCGYSSTALRERIYCRSIPGREMAGILIYTATPDSEGSLGGLVEQGETHRFGAVLWQALQDAQFCSSDPLCAEHDMQDHGDLNGAACHACTLVAETSCERSNRFLDRSFLVPTVSNRDVAYFQECI